MQGSPGASTALATPPPQLSSWGRAPLSKAGAVGIVAGALTTLDPTTETVEAGVAWATGRGVLVVLGGSCVHAGFGLASGLQRTAGLVTAIATANQRDSSGHLWLAAGRNDRHWSLIWGLTLPYAWLTPDALQGAILACWVAEGDSNLRSRFSEFGGGDYWAPMVEEAGGVLIPALVLWEQLA